MIVIGINPSKAITGKSDRTITIVSRVMKALKYKEMVMLNLFTCFQTDLHKVKMNERSINTTQFNSSDCRRILKNSDVIIAWGVSSDFSKQKENAIKEILETVPEKRIWCINKDGKLIENVSINNGKLAYTGNNNYVIFGISAVAIVALVIVCIMKKRKINA